MPLPGGEPLRNASTDASNRDFRRVGGPSVASEEMQGRLMVQGDFRLPWFEPLRSDPGFRRLLGNQGVESAIKA